MQGKQLDLFVAIAQLLTITISVIAAVGAGYGIGVKDADFTRADQFEQTRLVGGLSICCMTC